ncbi:MAG TPA: two-component regulator propeller domain-containing protein [Mucilaginibacter sp.]|nr:two-component regulator propeller domain-containing protein [Mucilaginibacter sp.]
MTFKILSKHVLKNKQAVLCRLFFVLVMIPLCHLTSSAQKYTFSHYDIEDGLIESQVNNLALDNQHRLWIATFGGACRFDGKEFTSYTRQNGMPSNFINNVFVDKSNIVWFGTQSGLMKLVNNKLVSCPVPVKLKSNHVRSIAQDGSGTIWFIINNRLFKVSGNTCKEELVQDTIKEPLLCLAVDHNGRLYASIHRKGIYYLDKGKWLNLVTYPKNDMEFIVTKMMFDRKDNSRLLLLSYSGIYSVKDNMLQTYQSKLSKSVKGSFLSLEQDTAANLWVGTSNGAYYLDLKKQQTTHFVAINGLSDNAITDIYNDADNNLWLASQGNGLYKYEGDHFVMFDRTQGLPDNEVVIGITKGNNNNVLLGINGAGLFRYDGKKLMGVKLPKEHPELERVQCLYTDNKGVVWIGTDHAGLWTYDKNNFQMIKGSDYYGINAIEQDGEGNIWAVAPGGAFYLENNTLKHLDGFSGFSSSIISAGKDSIIVGTQDGIVLAINKKIVKNFKLDAVRTSAVFCMLNYKNMLLIGTDDRGIFVWNKSDNIVKNYSVKEGLNSNTIYSLVTDDNGVIWVGTGRGANRFLFDDKNKSFTVRDNGSSKNLILESNQNAALYTGHKVWIGTTKGVVVYDIGVAPAPKVPPHVVIQSVKLIPQSGEKQSSTTITNGTKLFFSNRHLSISFLGVYLKDPENVSYRYKLKGLDSAYSLPVKNNVVDYPSLPAANYTFEVKAITTDGTVSANTASFSFSITPPFYQTWTFRILGIVFFVLVGVSIQSYRHRVKINRQRIIAATKREESLKIRQQTAEDFHDELGNKLTRITVLSEILDTKMDQSKTDQKKLLEQIKQNAASLYNGTKDILWALDPQSDNLYEILNHIRDFGKELFLDTPIEFEFNGIDESLSEIKLPMEYSRNIPMIFKELLNNILKHSHATVVTVSLNDIQKDEMHLTMRDNGCGFDDMEIRKGQGITNIITRTKRINGSINIQSEKGKGTLVDLKISIKPVLTH